MEKIMGDLFFVSKKKSKLKKTINISLKLQNFESGRFVFCFVVVNIKSFDWHRRAEVVAVT